MTKEPDIQGQTLRESSEGQTPEEIMTLAELARYLKVAEKSVLRMVRRGDIPGTKVASQWRFMRAVIDDWFMSRMRAASERDLRGMIDTSATVPLSRLLGQEHLLMGLEPGSKEDVLRRLVTPLIADGTVQDAAGFVALLMERERMVSTGVGQGIAFPHVRDPDVCPVTRTSLVLGLCPEGTDFEAMDGAKTHLFFLVGAKDEVVHLRIMAQLSLILRAPTMVDRLLAAPDEMAISALLVERDQETLLPKPTTTSSSSRHERRHGPTEDSP